MQEVGAEYGTTTGRRRRCGWLDLVVLKYSHSINGYDTLNLTKLDVLDGLKEIEVAVAYELNGKEIAGFPGESTPPIFCTRRRDERDANADLLARFVFVVFSFSRPRPPRQGDGQVRYPPWMEHRHLQHHLLGRSARNLQGLRRVHREVRRCSRRVDRCWTC